jgi:hypothetical protein
MQPISASPETVPDEGPLRPPTLLRSITMKKFAVLLALAVAAPFAVASEDGIDLMPNARGIEMTQYVSDTSTAVNGSEEFYNLGNGGVSPQ